MSRGQRSGFGRNILILPVDASVLRQVRQGVSALAGRAHLGLGYVMAFALFSAKSAGTENAPVFRS